jgi:hypothetical protein
VVERLGKAVEDVKALPAWLRYVALRGEFGKNGLRDVAYRVETC